MVKSVKNNKISLSFKIGDFGEAEELSSRNEVISKCNLGTTEFRAPEGRDASSSDLTSSDFMSSSDINQCLENALGNQRD